MSAAAAFSQDLSGSLGPGIVLEPAGQIIADSRVISGERSILGSHEGPGSYTAFLRTEPTVIPFTAGKTYEVSFSYRIVTAPDQGFGVLFYSPKGGAQGVWLPSRTITGAAGDTGRVTLRNTLGAFDDYRVHWNVIGIGAIVIDNIEFRDDAGRLILAEGGERTARLAQAFLPVGRAGRGYWVAPALTGGTPPYAWKAAGDLPPGFALSEDGNLTAESPREGSYAVTAEVKDAAGVTAYIRLQVTIAPAAAPGAGARAAGAGAGAVGGIRLENGTVVVRPTPYAPAFRNPLEGMRPYVAPARAHPFATLARQHFEWNLLENSESDTVERIRQATDRLIGDLPAYNIKMIPRVYLTWPPDRRYWPSDLTPGDYSSPAFRARMTRLISRIGEVWNNDPRIAYVETGIIGEWGEQHHPGFGSIGGDQLLPWAMEKEFGDAYKAAFPDTLLMRRYPRDFISYPFGIHWDVFGSFDKGFWGNDSTGMSALLTRAPLKDLWKNAVMGGEIDPTFMGEPDFSQQTMENVVRKHSDRLVGLIRKLHWNHLGALEIVNTADAELWAKASEIQNALGYRFVIEEARYTARAEKEIALSLSVRNTGSSPFYYNWPLEVSLLNPDNHRPLWKTVLKGIDVRSWLPGTAVGVQRTLTLPAVLPAGRYVIAVAILDPAGMVPSARFAVDNYFNGGRTPLGPIGISADPGPLDVGPFDDLAADRSLYYLPGG